jgi:DNA-binding NtrC family response regulator
MTNNKERVLVVDDEPVVRMSFARSLAAEFDAHTVPDGDEALREMERQPADVVLLDLRLPGAQGFELLEAMKRKWPETEVVVITGYPSVDSAKQAVRLGAADYLAKPIGANEVMSAARNALVRKLWTLRIQPERTIS